MDIERQAAFHPYKLSDEYAPEGLDSRILSLGQSLTGFLKVVESPENPASEKIYEEGKMVALLMNCGQWLKGALGSYQLGSLNSLAANVRGMFECHVTFAFLMRQQGYQFKRYLEKYDKFRYVEKYRMLSHGAGQTDKIKDDYEQYAKPLFEHKKEKIDKEWTGEGLSVLDMSRITGFDQSEYDECFKKPAMYLRNTSLIREFFIREKGQQDTDYANECAVMALYVFQHCMLFIQKYADYFKKEMPARATNNWIRSFQKIALLYI